MFHAGFVVKDRPVEDRFYRDLLGFRMYWHGGMKDTDSDWVEIQVPDGSDWIEYMLNILPTADHDELGVMNHLALGVASMNPAFEQLRAHGLQTTEAPEIGRDGKWQFDIFDPDATRVEFMEFKPAQAPCCNAYEGSHPEQP
jgi:catechol 2,3-dioxygenase-like lactoylglutathione lyase family enzyme